MEGGVYWRTAFIRSRRLLEAAFIGGRPLKEGGVNWRAAFIRRRRLSEGGRL